MLGGCQISYQNNISDDSDILLAPDFPATSDSSSAADNLPIAPASAEALSDQAILADTQTISEETDNIAIDAQYPKTNIGFVDQTIDYFVQTQIDDFKNQYQDVEKINAQPYSMWIDYQIFSANRNFFSVLFMNSYETGGAHPNHLVFTYNFDIKNERRLSLADIFPEHQSDILNYVKNELKQNPDYFSENIDELTGQDIQKFTLTDRSIIFHFSPYEVAAYAFGPIEVSVEYEKITHWIMLERLET